MHLQGRSPEADSASPWSVPVIMALSVRGRGRRSCVSWGAFLRPRPWSLCSGYSCSASRAGARRSGSGDVYSLVHPFASVDDLLSAYHNLEDCGFF
jgi:hypothetical protein